MVIHLKLNKLSLDDYYENRIKARLADPQAFQDLQASLNIPEDIGDEKAEGGDCAVEASSDTADGQTALVESSTCCDGEIAQELTELTVPEDIGDENAAADCAVEASSDMADGQVALAESSTCCDGEKAQEQTEGKEDQIMQPVSEMQRRGSSDDKTAGDVPGIVEATDQTAASEPVAEELAATSVSDVTAKSVPEGNQGETVQQVTSWFDEAESALKGEQTSSTGLEADPTSPEIQDHGSPTTEPNQKNGQKKDAKQDLGVARQPTETNTKTVQTKTKNFKIDDAPFLRNKSIHSEPLFSPDEAARIRHINLLKADLIDSLVNGFAIHKRLRTSRNYFQLP
jgi:hypothetical protein